MSAVSDAFSKRLGKVASNNTLGFSFSKRRHQFSLIDLVEETGAGYFLDGFVFLFGEPIATCNSLLAEWSFLFKQEADRIVIGRNAYGALLVLEDAEKWGTVAPVGLVDPLRVNYFTDPDLVFMNMVGNWLPQEKLPGFLDDAIYQEWISETGQTLAWNEILAIKEPLSLGGSFTLDNFQVEDIFDYYKTSGAIYQKYIV